MVNHLSVPTEQAETDDSETEEQYQAKLKGRLPLADPNKVQIELQAVVEKVGDAQTSQAVQARTFPPELLNLDKLITYDISPDLLLPRQQVQASLNRDTTLDQRTYSLNRWTAGVLTLGTFGGLAGAATAIYEAIRSQNNKTGPVLPPGTPDTPLVTSLLDQWNGLSDQDFWNALATYVDVNAGKDTALTLTDQYQFMTYVMDLWPLTTIWTWNGADVVTARDYFISQYATNGDDAAAMYRAVPGYTYQGQTMPRAVAATVLQYALAQLIVQSGADSVHRRLSLP